MQQNSISFHTTAQEYNKNKLSNSLLALLATSYTMSYIFLDKISNSPHVSLPSSSPEQHWRATLVQPVTVPNLAHTGIRSAFTYSGAPVLRPDGGVSATLKRHISKEFRGLPKQPTAYDPLDMSFRDKEERRRKAERLQRKKLLQAKQRALRDNRRKSLLVAIEYGGSPFQDNNLDSDNEEVERVTDPDLSETQLSAMSLVASKRSLSPERQKKPFSEISLFNALLESQVCGSTSEWDLTEMM